MKWEYKIVHINTNNWTETGLPDDVGAMFDQWGEQGWELVRTEPILKAGWLGNVTQTAAFVVFFKRPKT